MPRSRATPPDDGAQSSPGDRAARSSVRDRAARSVAPALALVALAIAGCGDSGGQSGGAARAAERPTAGAPAQRPAGDGAREAARAFAGSVLSGRTARMCRLLRGQARRAQGCGEEGEDFGPMLRLTIRTVGDVRLISASDREARAAFPRLGRDASRRPRAGWCRPQQLRLQRRGDRWFVVELSYGGDFEPVRAGCHGLPSAARDPQQALPVPDAGEGRCPPDDPEPLEPDSLEQARGAALRQASVLYAGTDLTGMRATRAAVATDDDGGRGGYARATCGGAVQERTVVVWLDFPAMGPSASLSQGVVLVSRFGRAYRVWAVLH